MKYILIIVLFINSIQIFSQEIIDKIVAVVDNEVILQSELEFQVAMFAAQRKLDPNDSKLKEQLLELHIIQTSMVRKRDSRRPME